MFDRFRNLPKSGGLAEASAAVAHSPSPLPGDRLAAQGLFVIGPARSGTTILQNALNDSSDIFLLGEPRLHRDPGSADFASRYNGMHRSWGNQENKSSYCPRLFDQDADWRTSLARLAELHRYVGAKIVINPAHAPFECDEVFHFQCRHFYDAHYLFTFRNPLDVLMSTRGLAQLNGGRVATHGEVLRGYVSVAQLYLRCLRNLPHVRVVFHEAMTAEVFGQLEAFLDTPFPRAMDYYDRAKVRHYQLADVAEPHRAQVAEAMALYADFKREALAGFALSQIEQNDGHLDAAHFTPLGSLSLRMKRFLAGLQEESA